MKKVKITFLFALLAAFHSCKKAEKIEVEKPTVVTVSTLAGSGAQGYLDGTGFKTSFFQPINLAMDAAENIYVADERNNCIRKITPSGVVTTVAGNGIAGFADGIGTAAQFNNPQATIVDVTGNIYVADAGNNCIRKISSSGVVSTFAGLAGSGDFADGTGANARFNYPFDLCIDGSGNLIVADINNNRLRKITPAGVVTTFVGNGSSGFQDGPISQATMASPTGLVYDASSGNIYVAQNTYIRKITPQGEVSLIAGKTNMLLDNGYIDGPGLAAKFNQVGNLAIDKKGNLYAADSENHLIRKITTDGYVSTYAGTFYDATDAKYKDGPANQAYFARPRGIVANKEGDIFVSERDGNKIRKITETTMPDAPDEITRKNWNNPVGWK